MAKKKSKRIILPKGKVHILATFNNTIINITDENGKTIVFESCGSFGFKGARKSTPYAASSTASKAGQRALEKGVKEVAVLVKGPGSGRDSAIKSLKAVGLRITSITDVTSIPHNGCRQKKRRRV